MPRHTVVYFICQTTQAGDFKYIGKMMLDALKQSSIDVDKFKAHSIRGASTSKAVNMDVAISDIISPADWTNIRTFEKFYHRPLESEDYLPAVLREEANC